MISESAVRNAVKLAKLSGSDEEIARLANQLGNIMQMIDVIKEVDCDGVEPLKSVCDQGCLMREDVVTEEDLGEKLFSNAPGKDSDFAKEIRCFVVPKVVE